MERLTFKNTTNTRKEQKKNAYGNPNFDHRTTNQPKHKTLAYVDYPFLVPLYLSLPSGKN